MQMNPRFAVKDNQVTVSSGVMGFPTIRVIKYRNYKQLEVTILRFPRVRLLKEKQYLEDNYKTIMDFLYIAEIIAPCETIDEVVKTLTESVFVLGGVDYTLEQRK